MKPTLLVMAAGLGSRFGGLKQITRVGKTHETILHYSIYDAKQAGFGKLVFIVNDAFRDEFIAHIDPFASHLFDNVHYISQSNDVIAKHTKIPKLRTKPFGTACAVYAAHEVINEPFAVINADDFYGRTSFETIAKFLFAQKNTDTSYAMIAYRLKNTLSHRGLVSRGICEMTDDMYLRSVKEYTSIGRDDDGSIVQFTQDGETFPLDENDFVSLNTWGFTPQIFGEIERGIPKFLETFGNELLTAEYYLPSVVDTLIHAKHGTVKALPTKERWYGITYRDDLPPVKKAIAEMIDAGVYPESLF